MAHIFISYSRKDKQIVVKLAEELRRVYGYNKIWYDDELRGGEEWWRRIRREIKQCNIFMFLVSNDSLISDYCQRELKEALERRKQILPIIIRPGTELSGNMHVPYALSQELSSKQILDMSKGIEDAKAITDLHAAIQKLSIPRWADILPVAWIKYALIAIVVVLLVASLLPLISSFFRSLTMSISSNPVVVFPALNQDAPAEPTLIPAPIDIPTTNISPQNASNLQHLGIWRDGRHPIAFTPDSKTLLFTVCVERGVLGCTRADVVLRDIRTGRDVQRLERLPDVKDIAVSPDGHTFLVTSGSSLLLFDTTKDDLPKRLIGHSLPIHNVSFNNDGRFALSGTRDIAGNGPGEMILWDINSGQRIRVFQRNDNSPFVTSDLRPDGAIALSGHWRGVTLWDTSTGDALASVGDDSRDTDWVFEVSFSPDGGSFLFTGGRDIVTHFDAERMEEIRRYNGSGPFAFSSDGQLALFTSFDALTLWNVSSGEELSRLPYGTQQGSAVFSPDNRLIATTEDGIHFWGINGG